MINLQENVLTADLQAETFYTIISEKRPEKALVQYYRWLKENQEEVESLITLKQWSATEADYQIQVTELKHGLRPGNCNWKPQEQKKNKSFAINRDESKRKIICKVCGEDHANWHCHAFKSRSIEEKVGHRKEARAVLQVFRR